MESIDPLPWRNVHEEDDEPDAFADAHVDVRIGGGRSERGRVVQQVDPEEAGGALGDLADQGLRTRRRLDAVAKYADAAGVADGGHQRRGRAAIPSPAPGGAGA